MNNVLIVGHGEVGQSVERLYTYKGVERYNIYTTDVFKKTPEANTYKASSYNGNIDVVHICIPYTKTFVTDVVKTVKGVYTPNDILLLVIHSTIPIYTTELISDKLKNKYIYIVHSPVMGVHPNLTESMRTFKKLVGGSKHAVKLATEHFNSIRVTTEEYDSSNETEAAKLLSTTYYAWNITFMRMVNDFCKLKGLDFDEVYTKTNEIYNEGYEKMGMSYVRRPVLKYMPGKIGGHCLIPNMKILKNDFNIAKWMLDMDKKNGSN